MRSEGRSFKILIAADWAYLLDLKFPFTVARWSTGVHVSLPSSSPPCISSTQALDPSSSTPLYTAGCTLIDPSCVHVVLLVEDRALLLDPLEAYTSCYGLVWSWDALMRHSCEPNSERIFIPFEGGEEGQNRGWKYACRVIRRVEEGEELTVDWERLMEAGKGVETRQRRGSIVMKCTCGAAHCRGTVRR